MQTNLSKKARRFFAGLGKRKRILLPVAVIGLAITLLIEDSINYFRINSKRFASVLFVICFFIIGNSFAYPVFSFDSGFVSDEVEIEYSAESSDISLTNQNEMTDYKEVSKTKKEYMDEQNAETYSLEEILESVDIDKDSGGNKDVDYYNYSFSEDDWRLVLINKQHPIADGYTFPLGKLSGNMQCDERIIDDLLLMMKDASDEGVSLVICSPYRDLEKQEKLFLKKIQKYMNSGYSYMESYRLSSQAVTVPGASEHQVGLALDIVSNDYKILDENFAKTKAGMWLKDNCASYGFIVRYPENKEYITSIEYEPWHFRYVGREAAMIITKEGLTLEEFWDKYL